MMVSLLELCLDFVGHGFATLSRDYGWLFPWFILDT